MKALLWMTSLLAIALAAGQLAFAGPTGPRPGPAGPGAGGPVMHPWELEYGRPFVGGP